MDKGRRKASTTSEAAGAVCRKPTLTEQGRAVVARSAKAGASKLRGTGRKEAAQEGGARGQDPELMGDLRDSVAALPPRLQHQTQTQ